MTTQLPPLPEPLWGYLSNTSKFSTEQMRDYARAALAQFSVEPVALTTMPDEPPYAEYAKGIEDGFDIGQRAAARQPLTDEQIAEICIECAQVTPSDVYFARAIEAAHGIKATGEGAA